MLGALPGGTTVTGDGRSRATDYRAARIGAAAALIAVVVLLAIVDAFSEHYSLDLPILLALLGAVGGLLGVEVLASVRKDVK
jgi:hypothetical protein